MLKDPTWTADHHAVTGTDADGNRVTVPADRENGDYAQLVAAGVAIAPFVPREADYGRAIQAHVDATAQGRGYLDAVTCASYAASTIPAWQADGQAFVVWRDAVWSHVYTALAAVQQGQAPAPSIEALVACLPAIVWPN